MGMTIDEALETIKGNRWIACSEKYQEAMNLIETTVHKYQKIQEIMKSKKMNALNIGLLIPKDMACVLHEIKEVIEDENVD